ncbi:MAG: RNA polymerase sigma-70 factor [Pedobacter sp.]|nr:MAG: RNA polymerase sigma-70 factor [Pedobacter sp.]
MAIKPLINERELLAKIAGGDQRAFTDLFEGYARPLAAFVQTLTSATEITEEIIQDCFIKVWQKRESLESIENFSGYLYIMCRNHTLAQLKKLAISKTQRMAVEAKLLDEIQLEELDNPAEEYRVLIEQAVSRLPEQQRKVYMLSRYDRLKHEEIAKLMNLSPETVKKYIMYAVDFIRKDLGTPPNTGIIMILTTAITLT